MDSKYSEKVIEKIFFDPVDAGANRLCILTENATPNMVSWLLTTYSERGKGQITIELVIESTFDGGIDIISHEGFKELQKNYCSGNNSKFICSYLHQPPKSQNNSFIWLFDERPMKAFSCPCDFTQASLLSIQHDCFNAVPAVEAYELFVKLLNRTIYCNHAEVIDYINIRGSNNITLLSDNGNSLEKCVLSLITRTGETGTKSGLNWGQRNKRNRNEAYIPLPSKIAKSGFFPLNKQHFLVLTDDHHTLLLRVEQQNDKAITTPASNAQLGEYFRNRLGLANGAYIHASDLRDYGRTDVTFYKIDEEQYYMDFSV